MQLAHRWLDRNLTRLELVIALIILLAILGSFMRYMTLMFARAEARMVESTIISLNTSLGYHMALAILRNDTKIPDRIGRRSPVYLVQSWQKGFSQAEDYVDLVSRTATFPVFHKPVNYRGEFLEPDFDLIEEGDWYYDMAENTLNYRVVNRNLFENNLPGDGLLRYRVHLDYADVNGNGSFEPAVDEFKSVYMKAVH